MANSKMFLALPHHAVPQVPWHFSLFVAGFLLPLRRGQKLLYDMLHEVLLCVWVKVAGNVKICKYYQVCKVANRQAVLLLFLCARKIAISFFLFWSGRRCPISLFHSIFYGQ